jgi:predicted nucleic acid-binding protein
VIVVSDSSALIALSAAGHFSLLRELYGRVLIPAAVHREVVLDPDARFGAKEVADADWIEVCHVSDVSLVTSLVQGGIGHGESEAIVLAIEERADILLIDDLRGRQAAARHGLTITGVLGIFLLAKRRGLVTAIKPLIDGLTISIGFRVAAPLYEAVLRSAGEL